MNRRLSLLNRLPAQRTKGCEALLGKDFTAFLRVKLHTRRLRYPFVAPSANPEIRNFCKKMKMTAIGNAIRIAPAAKIV